MIDESDPIEALRAAPDAFRYLKRATQNAGVDPAFGNLVCETLLAGVQYLARSNVPLWAIRAAVGAEYGRARIAKLQEEREAHGLSDPAVHPRPGGETAGVRTRKSPGTE